MVQMKRYVEITQKIIAEQDSRCVQLKNEIEACERQIECLQLNVREAQESVQVPLVVKLVSQFNVEHLQSGGEILERIKDHAEVNTADNVVQVKMNADHSLYRVILSKVDPCPSPSEGDIGEAIRVEVDVGKTMCDIWEGIYKMDKRTQNVQHRKERQRHSNVKNSVCDAFGCCDVPEESTLFRAACGFVQGSQEQCHQCDDDENSALVVTRCSKKDRKNLLTQMVTYMYEGEVVHDLEQKILRKKRFSTVKLARVSDMNSSFNPSALGAIASCEGGKGHGEMGLLCAESTLRRCLNQVHKLSQDLGFYSLPVVDDGNVWCWGDDTEQMKAAVNLYVKKIYVDACCESVTANNPWVLPLTGDGVRTSQRGTFVSVIGAKMADTRLVNQERSGKTMYQGSDMYTPAAAGYVDEKGIMPYFQLLVDEFLKIEDRGYCVVKCQEYPVYIKTVVIADLAFLHKYMKRGGGSHSATCFCLFCGALRNFRHHGYPGGCRKCRLLGVVYDDDGTQICLHYEACTGEFLLWQSERYAALCLLVPEFPLTSLPAWEDVAQLRLECLKRCVGTWAGWRGRIEKKGKGQMTGEALSDWIMKYTRDDATLSQSNETGVMFCPIKVVLASLSGRKIKVPARATGSNSRRFRLQLKSILQLEQEYTRMTMHIRDTRFGASAGIPLERLILCVLHCPMRTHEKVLTMLFQQACQNRLPKKSRAILDDMVVIIRRLASLKETWTYVWEKGAACVGKVKLHWDQSKHIFREENLLDLETLIKLAITPTEQEHWVSFVKEYIKCIDLLTVSRDYTAEDVDQLELYCNETYRLLVAHCGGKQAVTNYFHYIGSGHVVWMCRAYGNIWRYRNEGVEAFNKILSKRTNMFNSHGNKGNTEGSVKVQPFEVLGKWLGRYAMWQLEMANELFVANGGKLGPSEIAYDVDNDIWEYVSDCVDDDDDGQYSVTSVSSGSDTESDLDEFDPEDELQCVYIEPVDIDSQRYSMRKRKLFA